ncbi:uncharacterized protein LOC124949315 [Vespa velutina]|uniref:uncharacterized protein LOC124949315 n=1 Tax=Vespa velutina TaxID=202808 RepID=UPI001FB5580E|nr:uncharacterized protein LOC124949315 [Vespa velutina]
MTVDTGIIDNLSIILSKHNPFTGVINFQNGSCKYNIQMEACTFSQRFHDFDHVEQFSELHKLSYYLKRIGLPHYVAVITNCNLINQFSLATRNFNMPYAAWLLLFICKECITDYCHSPLLNILYLKFYTEMLVHCSDENILRELYSIYKNRIEINDFATWSLKKGIINIAPGFLYDRRYNLRGLIMRDDIIKDSSFINSNEND